jgi:hypothetical protein
LTFRIQPDVAEWLIDFVQGRPFVLSREFESTLAIISAFYNYTNTFENKMVAKTADAYSWTPSGGLKKGQFQCKGAIFPPRRLKAPADFVYDVLIIGAGYAGLSAGRDLTDASV